MPPGRLRAALLGSVDDTGAANWRPRPGSPGAACAYSVRPSGRLQGKIWTRLRVRESSGCLHVRGPHSAVFTCLGCASLCTCLCGCAGLCAVPSVNTCVCVWGRVWACAYMHVCECCVRAKVHHVCNHVCAHLCPRGTRVCAHTDRQAAGGARAIRPRGLRAAVFFRNSTRCPALGQHRVPSRRAG